jgi:hypothetical protein
MQSPSDGGKTSMAQSFHRQIHITGLYFIGRKQSENG